MPIKTKTEETYGDVEFQYRDYIPAEEYDLDITYPKVPAGDFIDARTGEPATQNAEGLWPFPDQPQASEGAKDLILLDVGPLTAPLPADDFLF